MASQFTFDAIGTKWVIEIYDDISSQEEMLLYSNIKNRIVAFDKVYSRFRADSLVTEMAQHDGIFTLPEDGKKLMTLYKDFYDITRGQVTPFIGQVLVDAGYDVAYSFSQKKELEKPPLWEDVLIYEHPLLTLKKPVLLDFGAAGKGYLIDLVGEVIEQHKVERYCVDAGGDIRHHHKEKSLKIGLENPLNMEEAIGVIFLQNKCLAASSGSRRKWNNITHIIDPTTLRSPQEIIATWALADTTILADALATALFFVSPTILLQHYNFEYIVVYKDMLVERSRGIAGELFSENN